MKDLEELKDKAMAKSGTTVDEYRYLLHAYENMNDDHKERFEQILYHITLLFNEMTEEWLD